MTTEPADPDDRLLRRYIRGTRQLAFHLELQPEYREPGEATSIARFLAGEPSDPTVDYPGFTTWMDTVRAIVDRGGRMVRVRVHEDPPNGYQRWLRWLGGWNVDAGETIHYLTRAKAYEIGLLPDAAVDYWLIDDQHLLTSHFDADGTWTGTELVTDPSAVAKARAWRDLAVRHGVPDPGRAAAT